MSVAPGGTAQSKPVVRLSSSRAARLALLLSGLEEGVDPVAADVAGAAGDQDGHVARPFRAITLVRLPRRKIRPSVNARVRAR